MEVAVDATASPWLLVAAREQLATIVTTGQLAVATAEQAELTSEAALSVPAAAIEQEAVVAAELPLAAAAVGSDAPERRGAPGRQDAACGVLCRATTSAVAHAAPELANAIAGTRARAAGQKRVERLSTAELAGAASTR